MPSHSSLIYGKKLHTSLQYHTNVCADFSTPLKTNSNFCSCSPSSFGLPHLSLLSSSPSPPLPTLSYSPLPSAREISNTVPSPLYTPTKSSISNSSDVLISLPLSPIPSTYPNN